VDGQSPRHPGEGQAGLAGAETRGYDKATRTLSELIREISELIQTLIPRTVQLRLELATDLPLVEADVSQIQQLIMNLVINGAEAIGEDTNGTVLVTTGIQEVDEAYILTTIGPAEEITPGTYVTLNGMKK
jgi:nitrogen-specific signal transduction histidine kinase